MRPSLLLGLCACTAAVDPDDDAPESACAWEAHPHAAVLAEGDWVPEGPDALAAPGDLLLANGHAAFVIQDPANPRTYYHYGGTPIDAVALSGCDQVGQERFAELGFLPSRLEVTDFLASTMRQLEGTSARVVSDGRDGRPAHVRVEATDSRFWLVDYELTRRAAEGDQRRPLSEALGIAITVDYVLLPDRPVLEVGFTVRNLDAQAKNPALGAAILRPPETPPLVYAEGALAFGGFDLQLGAPWFAMSAGDAAYAFAFDSDNTAWTEVSGVNALFDANQLLGGSLALQPAGEEGDTTTMRLWLSAGPGDEASATAPLLDLLPGLGGAAILAQPVSGRVVDQAGAGVAGAWVDVERKRKDGAWRTLERLRADATGAFAGTVARTEDGAERRVVVRSPELDSPEPIALDATAGDLEIEVPTRGTLTIHALDGRGSGLPVRATLVREGAPTRVIHVPPTGGTWTVAAGSYQLAVTRGTTHAPVEEPMVVRPQSNTRIDATLPEVIDTTGWISVDGHVHAAPSPDSDVSVLDRFATAATEGLDVVVHTEHEVIVDQLPVLASSPWAAFVGSIAGEEVTATVPEHLNMWGVEVNASQGVRGAPVPWYGKDLGTLFGLMRARGAEVVTLNHPKYGCNWLCLIGWDAVNAVPTVTDATRFGLAADAQVWSWDFDAVELQNGFTSMFQPLPAEGSSLFEDWQGWLHHGHRITAVAVSDVHGLDTPGSPRTYVASPTDDPAAFTREHLGSAIRAGKAQISSGAFLDVSIGEAGIGDTVTVTEGPVVLAVRVQALEGIRIDGVRVYANCDLVAVRDATAPDAVEKLDTTFDLALAADTQIVVVADGSGAYPLGLRQPGDTVPRALTNPIFVDVDGNGTWDPPGAKGCRRTLP